MQDERQEEERQEEGLQEEEQETRQEEQEPVAAQKEDQEDDLSEYKRSTAKRMQQLLRERKQDRVARQKFERQAEVQRKENEALRKRLEEIDKESAEAKALAARARMKKAMEEQDDEAMLEAQEALIEAKVPRRVFESPPVEENSEPPPVGAAAWVEENRGWFEEDPVRLERAKEIEKELFRDGHSPNDDNTYQKLDELLYDPAYKPGKQVRNPPAAPASRERGDAVQRGKARMTKDGERLMEKFGLDPADPKHRKYWLENARGGE